MPAEETRSPKNPTDPRRRTTHSSISNMKDSILSPGFRSAAAVAGWDEEALLLATLIVEDTPVRETRHKKRPNQFISPPSSNSTRKRRSLRHPPSEIPPVVLDLDDDLVGDDEVAKKEDIDKNREDKESDGDGEEKTGQGEGLACMDRLREELSCAICLEICFEPSTTPCGHSFCKKCLKSATAKCGKRCPKCRQIISIGRAWTVNTVLWNTIQLLFPQEIEVKKKARTRSPDSADKKTSNTSITARSSSSSRSNSSITGRSSSSLRSDSNSMARSSSSRSATQYPPATESYRSIRRRPVTNQSEDAALALRLQREEFMEAFQENREQPRSMARAELRSIAQSIRSRDRYI